MPFFLKQKKITRSTMFSFLDYFWHGKARTELEQKLSPVNLKVDDRMITETKLPTLIAHGDESSGKSTLLAEMIQFDMFDIGTNMITRMVWVYRLRFSATQTVPHIVVKIPGRSIVETTDPAKVRALIQSVHNEIEMSKQAISEMEGSIEIYSNSVPRMDIIDLPGSIAAPNQGEPHTVGELSRRIARKYLARPDHIVMYVQSSVALQRNSVAAGLVSEMKCERVLTVLTKVDYAVHQRTGLNEFMESFRTMGDNTIAVSNFRDRAGMSFSEVRDDERKFFVDNLSSSDYDTYKRRLGVPALLQRINEIAEATHGAEWIETQMRLDQEKLAYLCAQLDAIGPKLTSAELSTMVADGLLATDGLLEKMMRETWAEIKLHVPLKMDYWYAANDVDATPFVNRMNIRMLAQLDHVFEFSEAKMSRFENFCVGYRRVLTTRLSNRAAAFRERWNKTAKYLMLEHTTNSPMYSVERWFHAACACYIQTVLMKLSDADDQDNKPNRSSAPFLHFSSLSHGWASPLPLSPQPEAEVGPPPAYSIKGMFEALGTDLSCDESSRVVRIREDIQQQIEVLTGVITALKNTS